MTNGGKFQGKNVPQGKENFPLKKGKAKRHKKKNESGNRVIFSFKKLRIFYLHQSLYIVSIFDPILGETTPNGKLHRNQALQV